VSSVVVLADDARADRVGTGAEVEVEVLGGDDVVGLPAHGGVGGVDAVHRDGMAWGVDGAERGLAGDRDGDGGTLKGGGAEALDVEAVAVAGEAALDRKHLAVGDLDAAVLAGRDRENAGLQQAAARVLEQGRVAHPADDVLVGAAGLLGVEEFGIDGLAVHPHAELADSRAVGDREEVGALGGPVVGVVEGLVDARFGERAVDGDGDVVILHLEHVGEDDRIGAVGIAPGRVDDDDAVGAGRGGGKDRKEQEQDGDQEHQSMFPHGMGPPLQA